VAFVSKGRIVQGMTNSTLVSKSKEEVTMGLTHGMLKILHVLA